MTPEELQHTAKLAQLDLTANNSRKTEQKIDTLFDLLKTLDELDVSTITPLTHPLDMQQPLRDDVIRNGGQRATIETIATSLNNHLYVVPQVLTED